MSDDSASEVAVLTGGTSGLGRVAALRLAELGYRVAIIGRNERRGTALEARGSDLDGAIRFYRVDLAAQSAVRALATDLRETYDRIDRLIHNAGLSSAHRIETEDGIERTLAVNHLAPYLLTHELLDRLRASEPARIVVTASGIHTRGTLDFTDLQFEDRYDSIDAYARSKLANIAFTVELARRLEGTDLSANCFHPGFIPSTRLFREAPIWTRLVIRAASVLPVIGTSEQEGARRLLQLTTEEAFGQRSGVYLAGNGITSPSPEATDPENRRRLWERSADLVGVDPDWP